MAIFKHTFFLIYLVSVSVFCAAQKPKPVVKPATVQKSKLPKLYTSLGNISDSVSSVTADEAIQLINKPLTINDDKKAVYTISSYQCMYKRKGVTEDEESGKVSPITSISVQRFTTSPITTLWRNIITEQLKPGEEIYFFDIVVKGTNNKLFFAPNIKLLIK
jgi:hypothetical protein